DRILELYLNKVYFGDGLYGAEASARGYFGRHASEVSVSEAALLAGLVKSPSTSAPTVNPTRAKARRNVVLQAMLDTGAIDPATWTTARRSDVVLHDTLRAQEPHGQYFNESRFNRAVQARRQPGSAFKPFVYATALEAGYTPVTVIDHLNDPVSTVQGAWTPEDEHSSAGAMTMRTALRTSSNRAAVRMLQQVGIARTVQYAKQLGVGDVPSVPSLALGSGEV